MATAGAAAASRSSLWLPARAVADSPVTLAQAVAPLKISGCVRDRFNRCIDNRQVTYTFSKTDFTNLSNGITLMPPPTSRRENRLCSEVLDARGNTVTVSGAAARRCKLNPPVPTVKTVKIFTQPVAGPGCSAYWYVENTTGAAATFTVKEAFWNGYEPGCGPPNEGNPSVETKTYAAPVGRTGIRCGLTPVDMHHSCSWHTKLTCQRGTNGNCEIN
ncbi:MAG: hypothetical protein ACKOPQ_10765 [Novosphingobium sp.]